MWLLYIQTWVNQIFYRQLWARALTNLCIKARCQTGSFRLPLTVTGETSSAGSFEHLCVDTSVWWSPAYTFSRRRQKNMCGLYLALVYRLVSQGMGRCLCALAQTENFVNACELWHVAIGSCGTLGLYVALNKSGRLCQQISITKHVKMALYSCTYRLVSKHRISRML